MILACVTVVFGVTTYISGEKMLKKWKAWGQAKDDLLAEIELDQRLVDQREDWDQQLKDLMSRLKSYPPNQRVTSQLMEQVNQLARNNKLTLSSQSPEGERDLGNIHEVSIKCAFRGNLESLVRFLFELQNKGPIFTVKILKVTPAGQGDDLKGNVTVDCAYTKEMEVAGR